MQGSQGLPDLYSVTPEQIAAYEASLPQLTVK
jgi:hypothetical protein